MSGHASPAPTAGSAGRAGHGRPPGYHGLDGALHCLRHELRGDMLGLFLGLNEQFGGGAEMRPIAFHFLGKPALLVTHPRHVHQVFKDRESFSQSSDPQVLERFRQFLGFNLVSVDHDLWRAVRPRTLAALTGDALSEYGAVMRRVMEEDCLPALRRAAAYRRPLDLFDFMLGFSSKAVFRSFMRLGADDVPDEVHPTLNRIFTYLRKHVVQPGLPRWFPTPANLQFKRDMNRIKRFIRPYIDEQKADDTFLGSIVRAHTRRLRWEAAPHLAEVAVALFGDGAPPDDAERARLSASLATVLRAHESEDIYKLGRAIVQHVQGWAATTGRRRSVPETRLEAAMQAALCAGGTIDRELVLEEMVSNLIGGSETTILMMTWALHYLAANPEVQETLRREVARGDSPVPPIEPATMKEQWPYLYNALRETLRLASPAAVFNRPVIKDVEIGGFQIKAGTSLWGSQFITQRSPHVWSEPERFRPERFEKPAPAGAFFPFTLGPRACVGMGYAYLEGAIGLATLVRNFNIRSLSGEVGYDNSLTFRPDRPIQIVLEPRGAGQ